MKKAIFTAILLTPLVSFASPLPCAPGDIFNIENGQKCPVVQAASINTTTDIQSLLNTIDSLKRQVSNLQDQLNDLNAPAKKASQIVSELSDIDEKLANYDPEQTYCGISFAPEDTRHQKGSKVCHISTESQKYIDDLNSRRESLLKDYAIIKGDSDKLPNYEICAKAQALMGIGYNTPGSEYWRLENLCLSSKK